MKVTYKDHSGSDLMTVDAARVSFDKSSEWYNQYEMECDLDNRKSEQDLIGILKDDDWRLINYLAKHGHFSPFNHSFITMHVEAPVFVARQLVKHEYMPWNEVSGRYITFKPKFWMPKSFRMKAENKKQGSGGDLSDNTSNYLRMIFEDSHKASFNAYESALRVGLCEEQARELLPLDLMTQWYWSGTLGAWAKMYNLRNTDHVQEETREVAKIAGDIIGDIYPISWKALTDGGN
jgi:thymidylate synthase (FAD)